MPPQGFNMLVKGTNVERNSFVYFCVPDCTTEVNFQSETYIGYPKSPSFSIPS